MQFRQKRWGASCALAIVLTVTFAGAPSLAAGLASLPALPPVMDCATLVAVDVTSAVGSKVSIQSAKVYQGAASYCGVRGEIAPHIGFEVRLPMAGWTQRYLQTGCGGLCGFIGIHPERATECVPVTSGAVVLASTDMGHSGQVFDASWGNDPQARADFGYRGVHLTALASKALIGRFYGRAPRYSYFLGCSDGGREALMEAQRFSGDFDGIAAGAPAMNFQVQNTFYHAWMARSNQGADGQAILVAAKLPALHRAALEACDALDGLKDGQITDPRLCHFDPAAEQCKLGQPVTDDCLTPAEVEVARRFYAGPRDAEGHRFTIGGPQVGSELAWRGVFVPDASASPIMSATYALGTIKYLAFAHNPPASYALTDFRFDLATFDRLADQHPIYDATDTDLAPFERRGGKLIIYHGWSDQHISPINTIAYYEGVEKVLGARRVRSFARLFLFPGMYHCVGGDGPSDFDVVTPLMVWVEAGEAPEVIVAGRRLSADKEPTERPATASGVARRFDRTRPVFAYPEVAHYRGLGAVDEAGSFDAGPPLTRSPAAYRWEGDRFMRPYIPR